MKIHNNHPSYIEFLKMERKTLSFLASQSYIAGKIPALSNDAGLYFYEYSVDKHLKDKRFSFQTNFNLFIENQERRLVLEALVEPNFRHVSYALSICDSCEEPFVLLRKFHFDYAIPIENELEPKPVYHFQFGGEKSPGLDNLNIEVEILNPWLSSPRLNNTPINLALLLDVVFCEFRDEVTNGITERNEWRQFIKSNEDFLLRPYYQRVGLFLSNHHTSNLLLRDYYYGR